MAEVEASIPAHTQITIDVSDYLDTIGVEVSGDDILNHLDECSTEDVLDHLSESEVIEYAVDADPAEVLEKLFEQDPNNFDDEAAVYAFVIRMFKRLPVTAQLASMCHLGHPMLRAVQTYLHMYEAQEACEETDTPEPPGEDMMEADFRAALCLLVNDKYTRNVLLHELGAFHAGVESTLADCSINQLHLFTKEEMTNDTQDQ